MLLGDEVEDLRRTVGGGRGSSRQPFTWMGGAQGDHHTENEGSISCSPPSVFPPLITVGLILSVCVWVCVCVFVTAWRQACVCWPRGGGWG